MGKVHRRTHFGVLACVSELDELGAYEETRDAVLRELGEIESQLAAQLDLDTEVEIATRLGIEIDVRLALFIRSRNGALPETKLVRRWHSLLASLREFTQSPEEGR